MAEGKIYKRLPHETEQYYYKCEGIGSESDPYVEKIRIDKPIVNEDNIIMNLLKNVSSNNMNIDGSVTPVEFNSKPSTGKYWIISEALLYLEGSTAFDSIKFANIDSLTNGVDFLINNTLIVNWRNNIDLITTFFDAESRDAFSKNDRSLAGRLSFKDFTNGSDGVRIEETYGISCKIQDNLSSLAQFFIRVKGVEFSV